MAEVFPVVGSMDFLIKGGGRRILRAVIRKMTLLEHTQIRNSLAYAILTTASQTINDAAWTKVLLNGEKFDVGSNFDVANSRYVAPVTGYYQVNAAVAVYDSATRIATAAGAIYVNGAAYTQLSRIAVTDIINAVFHCVGGGLVYAAAGQYIELYAYVDTHDAGTSLVMHTEGSTMMSIHLVSTT